MLVQRKKMSKVHIYLFYQLICLFVSKLNTILSLFAFLMQKSDKFIAFSFEKNNSSRNSNKDVVCLFDNDTCHGQVLGESEHNAF